MPGQYPNNVAVHVAERAFRAARHGAYGLSPPLPDL